MPTYVIHRTLGRVTEEQLGAAAGRSKTILRESFPDIVWRHSHVIRSAEGDLKTLCIYEAPDADRVRAHAEQAELPVDRIEEVVRDVEPADV